MEFVWSVSKLSTESVGGRRELVANSVHTADADATIASVVCIGHKWLSRVDDDSGRADGGDKSSAPRAASQPAAGTDRSPPVPGAAVEGPQ